MSSDGSAERLDLERDLPTTTEDVAVLRRLRHARALTFEQYLECLAALNPLPIERLRSRAGPAGAPFDLLG